MRYKYIIELFSLCYFLLHIWKNRICPLLLKTHILYSNVSFISPLQYINTSNKHSITCFSFLRIIRSSVSNNRHSNTPSPFLHQVMKLETLSLAKNVPPLAPGKYRTAGNWRTKIAMPLILDFPAACLRFTWSSA